MSSDISVRVIRNKGFVSIVEWSDGERFRRTVVPRNEVCDGENDTKLVALDSLEMGIPYGIDWEHRIPKEEYFISREELARQLEVSGIWTKEDYDKNPGVVQAAVLGTAREILTDLFITVRSIPKQEE